MVTINEYHAVQILLINNLITKYREGLTDGIMNSCGGFPVKNTKTNMPDTIRATFNNMNLDVVHVGGQICGFISEPDNSNKRKFHFLNHTGTNTDNLDVAGIKAWYTRPKSQEQQEPQRQPQQPTRGQQKQQPARGQQKQQPAQQPGYGGRECEIIYYPGVDRRYEGCPTKLDLSSESIKNQLNALFSRYPSPTGLPLEQMKKSFFTFLLVCSEGAKNSLVHEQVITKLITSAIEDNPHGPLTKEADDPLHRAFVDAILLAAKNCENGAIKYVNQPLKCKRIMDAFGMNTFAEHANVAYQVDNDLNRAQTYVNTIDSGNYQDCCRVLKGKDRTGQTLSQQIAQQIQQLARANPQWRLTSQQIAQQITQKIDQPANAREPSMDQQIQQIVQRIMPHQPDPQEHPVGQNRAQAAARAQEQPMDQQIAQRIAQQTAQQIAQRIQIALQPANEEQLIDQLADPPDLPAPPEGSDLELMVSWNQIAQEALHLYGGGSRPPSPSADGNGGNIAVLSDHFTNEKFEIELINEIGSRPSSPNDDPEDLFTKKIESNQEAPKNSTKNNDPDNLLDTVEQKAAHLNKIGVTEDPECLALIDEIVKNAEKALTVEVELENPSTYTPAFNPRGP